MREHEAPSSPVHIITLSGEGMYIAGNQAPQKLGPGYLLIFDSGEKHSIQALEEPLVFLAILHGAPRSG